MRFGKNIIYNIIIYNVFTKPHLDQSDCSIDRPMYFSVESHFRISLIPIWSNLTFISHLSRLTYRRWVTIYWINNSYQSTLTRHLIWQNNGLYHYVSTKSVLCLSHYSFVLTVLACFHVVLGSEWGTHSTSNCSCVMSSPVLPPTVQPRALHSFFKCNLNKAQRRCPKPKPKTTLCNLVQQLSICSSDGYVLLENSGKSDPPGFSKSIR